MQVKLFNTLSKNKEVLHIQPSKHVKIYVCGITPYDYAHIGHGRVYVTFDTLVRLLSFLGHCTTYVRNITDIDDKLLNKASQQGDINKYKDIATFYYTQFAQDLQQLGCLKPNFEPRVTECIPEIIQFIQDLIAHKNAYVIDHDVYFDITSFDAYGKLSKRTQEDLMAGARIDVNEKKRNPGDFALWKGNNEGMFWQSPWGYGRPGWHIECSVMAKKHLGITLDIHGGGMDLIFPHHENEIAQSEALHNKPFAHIWMHNAFVNINKEKMSKSLGNIISLRSLLEKRDPMVLRFFYLQHHYRTPIDFSEDELTAAQTAYKKLIAALSTGTSSDKETLSAILADQRTQAMLEALCDDLNTPKFFGLVFEHLTTFKQEPAFAQLVVSLMHNVLGLKLQPLAEESVAITLEIEALIQKREQARAEKNWKLADQIRDELAQRGYQARDKKI